MENIQNQNRFNHTHTHTIQRLNVAWYSINTQALNNTNFNSENRLHVCVKHKRLHVILFVSLAILTLQILRSGNNDQKKNGIFCLKYVNIARIQQQSNFSIICNVRFNILNINFCSLIFQTQLNIQTTTRKCTEFL